MQMWKDFSEVVVVVLQLVLHLVLVLALPLQVELVLLQPLQIF